MTNETDVRWWQRGDSHPALAFLTIGGGVLIAVFVVLAIWIFHNKNIGPELKLPLVVIFGVVVLLMVIGLLTFSFSQLNLASAGQALGLPDGSVRAIIALMLLVLFTIVGIFLYNSVASGPVQSVQKVNETQLTELRKQVVVVLTLPEGAGLSTVYFRPSSPAGEDIAKQLITLLGTLVTAVASFYFGSAAVSSAHEAVLKMSVAGVQPAPIVTGLTPASLKQGTIALPVKITGSNLGSVKAVTFAKGGTTLGTVIVNAGATEITITIKPDGPPGTYDVVLSDGTTEVARMNNAFTIAP
jgi:hypothetical protein